MTGSLRHRSRLGALAPVLVLVVGACDENGADGGPTTRSLVPPTRVVLSDGISNEIFFSVPDDALSVLVSVSGDASSYYALGQWSQDGAAPLVPDGWFLGASRDAGLCVDCADRIALSRGVFAALAPNNPSVDLSPGEHTLTVVAFPSPSAPAPTGSGEVVVAVDALVGDAPPTDGELDLRVHLATTLWDGDADALVEAVVARAAGILSQVGIRVGRVDVTRQDPVAEDAGSDQPDDPRFALMSASGSDGLDVYLVDRLAGGSLRGLSSSLPCGVLGAGEGILVALDTTFPPELALAHELGHALGLFHTIELDHSGNTPITDQLDDTSDDDATLLLYPELFGRRLSAEQGAVMRSHPRLRHR